MLNTYGLTIISRFENGTETRFFMAFISCPLLSSVRIFNTLEEAEKHLKSEVSSLAGYGIGDFVRTDEPAAPGIIDAFKAGRPFSKLENRQVFITCSKC